MFGSENAGAVVAQPLLDGKVGLAMPVLHDALRVVLGAVRPVAVGVDKLVTGQFPQLVAPSQAVGRDYTIVLPTVGQSLYAPVVMAAA